MISTKHIEIVTPGDCLGPAGDSMPGPGTHIHDKHIYASVMGYSHATQAPKPAGPAKRLTKIIRAPSGPPSSVSVTREAVAPTAPGTTVKRAEILPEVNSVVLCRVTRIAPRQANVAILVVGETVLEGEWQGLIRVADVRATEKDRVRIVESFRPGDIVRAVVVSVTCMIRRNVCG